MESSVCEPEQSLSVNSISNRACFGAQTESGSFCQHGDGHSLFASMNRISLRVWRARLRTAAESIWGESICEPELLLHLQSLRTVLDGDGVRSVCKPGQGLFASLDRGDLHAWRVYLRASTQFVLRSNLFRADSFRSDSLRSDPLQCDPSHPPPSDPTASEPIPYPPNNPTPSDPVSLHLDLISSGANLLQTRFLLARPPQT